MSSDLMTSFGPNVTSAEDDTTATTLYLLPRWIASETMLLLISVVTVYIFVALMHYSWRFRHTPRVSGSAQELRERYLHYSCAGVIVIAIARCVLHQAIVFTPRGPGSDQARCKTMMIAGRVVYNIAICLTYVHLWLRQHMFYTKNELRQLRTKVLVFVDWAVLLTIICTSAVLAIITFVPLEGKSSQETYHREKCNAFEYNSKLSLYLYAGLSLLYQLILVALFLYPIIVQKLQQKKDSNRSGRSPVITATGYPALWIGIRRGFVLTVVVILTDATLGCLVWILTRNYPDFLSSIIALNDVNLLINVVCCICTFRNWRKIVFGFGICRRMGWHHDSIMRSTRHSSLRRRVESENHTDGGSSEQGKEGADTVEEKKMLKDVGA